MAVAVPFLQLCGYVIGGWLLAQVRGHRRGKARRRRIASSTPPSCAPRCSTPQQVLPGAAALAQVVTAAGPSVTETDAALI